MDTADEFLLRMVPLTLGLFLFLAGGLILWKRYLGTRRAWELAVAVGYAAVVVLVGKAVGGQLLYQAIGLAVVVAACLVASAAVGLLELPGEILRRPGELLAPAAAFLVGLFLLGVHFLAVR